MTKDTSEIEHLIERNIESVVDQWDADNIIFEGEYGFSSVTFCQYENLLYEMIIENGGHYSPNHLVHGEPVKDEGWIYAFFDSDEIQIEKAKQLIKNYMREIRKLR